jgi:hypothetical protein
MTYDSRDKVQRIQTLCRPKSAEYCGFEAEPAPLLHHYYLQCIVDLDMKLDEALTTGLDRSPCPYYLLLCVAVSTLHGTLTTLPGTRM